MQTHVIAGSLSFCIFSLGLFLGGGVRPLLMAAMKSEPALIGPILTQMFNRYNIVALGLSAACLVLEIISARSLPILLLAIAVTLVLALKLPLDESIKRREHSGQIRGVGNDGERLDVLHQIVEKATILIILLSLASFVLNAMS